MVCRSRKSKDESGDRYPCSRFLQTRTNCIGFLEPSHPCPVYLPACLRSCPACPLVTVMSDHIAGSSSRPYLWRPILHVVVRRAVEEGRHQSIDRVPHHREVITLPPDALQRVPATRQKAAPAPAPPAAPPPTPTTSSLHRRHFHHELDGKQHGSVEREGTKNQKNTKASFSRRSAHTVHESTRTEVKASKNKP